MEILIPNGVVSAGRASGRCLGQEGGALRMGTRVLIKEVPETPLALFHRGRTQGEDGLLQPEEGPPSPAGDVLAP